MEEEVRKNCAQMRNDFQNKNGLIPLSHARRDETIFSSLIY